MLPAGATAALPRLAKILLFCSSVSGSCKATIGSLSSAAFAAETVDGSVCRVAPGTGSATLSGVAECSGCSMVGLALSAS